MRAAWCLTWLCWLSAAAAVAAPSAFVLHSAHTPLRPRSGQAVGITAEVGPDLSEVRLEYQLVEPGAYIELKDPAYASNWVALAMKPGGRSKYGGALYSAELPGHLQKHRTLVRYRFAARDAAGQRRGWPDARDGSPNLAYFVYDGIPAWKGAINPANPDPKLSTPLTFSAEAMNRVQAYHVIGKKSSIENAMWKEQAGGKEYKYTGTLVVEGQVFDHVRYRARGGVWRYALGKTMWKIDLAEDQRLSARNDFGQFYPVPWGKLNLRACIQQGDYGRRGEQGMFEAVGLRLFNLAGVPAPWTHWVQLRVISEAEESPPEQYRGDFWGLYLAIENPDGRFLKGHGLPSGNFYKMFGGGGELQAQGANQPANGADLREFLAAYHRPNLSEEWWRDNFDLNGYYSYRAITECIHHYDVGEGKNYNYYHNPLTGRWQITPWDLDLTWADHMYGSGAEPFSYRVLRQPVFALEYRNRLREIRDLLFNPEQAGQLIDEYAAVISDPGGAASMAEADRRKWDFHPAMGSGGASGWSWLFGGGGAKAGAGLYYQSAPTRNFAGMAQLMKDYVQSRGAWIDSTLLNDPQIPATPAARYAGPAGFPPGSLRFIASASKGANPFASLKWRLAEITPAKAPAFLAGAPRQYEIIPLWESEELRDPGAAASIPGHLVQPGHTYRVRVRMKDATGRWSHWSAPVEFVSGPN